MSRYRMMTTVTQRLRHAFASASHLSNTLEHHITPAQDVLHDVG